MSAPTLSASKWVGTGWMVPRPIYSVWWLQKGRGVVGRYVVADNRAMAIRKARRAWGKQMDDGAPGAEILIPRGLRHPPYGPPKVHLR